MRVFLDANVLFTAAHNPCGKAALLIKLGGNGAWSLHSSHYAVEEARRNLERKFPRCLAALSELLQEFDITAHHSRLPWPQGLAVKDRPIFQAALTCNATHLLTGDLKDFGRFMNRPDKTSGVVIQTVAEFLAGLE